MKYNIFNSLTTISQIGPMQNIKQILEISDPHRLIIAIGDFVARREGVVGYENLTIVEKYISGIYYYKAEVNNGGIDQFFFNSTGDRWKITLEGLQKIGANNACRILDQATKLFGEEGPSEKWIKRREQLKQFSEKTREKEEKLTDEFYRYEDNLSELMINFVKSHAHEFGEV